IAGSEPITMSGREMLLGTSFHLASENEDGGPVLAAWGRVEADRFDGTEAGLRIEGDVTTAIVGADVARKRWLAGAALAFSRSEGSFALASAMDSSRAHGVLEAKLKSVVPYARYAFDHRLSAWGLVGHGTGELTLTEDGGAPVETDIRMTMGAVGGRGTLVAAPEGGGFALALKSDAFWTRMTSEKVEGRMEGAKSDATRVRLVLDASRAFETRNGILTPRVELGVRHDGGDAETGTGVEVGAGIRYAGSGVTIEGAVRGLLAHEASGYKEWGVSGTVRIDPGTSDRGLSLTFAPSYGAASSGTDRLWSLRDARGLAANEEFKPRARLDAEAGYGLRGLGGLGTVTPYAGLALVDEGAESWRAGAHWQMTPNANLSLEGTRREAANNDAPEHGVMLRASLRW
ncbi:MAG: autotransporter domain-containing protein, partial [Rhodospirillaceae bacterium]|nr:autotransporter domain-containing protein [Rhodospirillaceae bacterium]